MDAMELIAFEIISNVGMAKSLAIEALRDVRMGNYEDGSKKIEESSEYLIKGHHALSLIHISEPTRPIG